MKLLPIVTTLLLTVLPHAARSQSIEPATFTVSPGQVTEAAVALTGDGPRLQVKFTPEQSVAFAEFTQRNLEKRVRIVVNGTLVSDPIIKSHIMGGSMEVIVASPEEGLSVAKALMNK